MNHLFIMNSTGTCSWRVYPIARALTEEGHQVVTLNLSSIREDQYQMILEWADVLTFQMTCAKELVERAKAKGIYTIFDCDDLIEEVPPQHPSAKQVQKKEYRELFTNILKQVDLITCSVKPLCDRYKKYGEVAQIENYIPAEIWERPYNPNTSETVRIGWAGGMSHQEDLDFANPIVSKVIKDTDNTKFIYCGGGGWKSGNPESIYRFGKDHFKDVPIHRREYVWGAKVELWPDKLNSLKLDVALAPLDENTFSRHKSQIKYYEYAINRWPGVYQKFLYEDKVKHGETGFLATTPEEWEKYIKLLVNDGRLRKEMGERAYRDIKDHYTFEGNRERWLEVYRCAGERSKHREGGFFVEHRK